MIYRVDLSILPPLVGVGGGGVDQEIRAEWAGKL
jgi:hypothetical protein